MGGTEVYVAALVQALERENVFCSIAAPARDNASYCEGGVSVFRFATTACPSFEHANGAPDRQAAANFASILAEAHPRIVHFHARTSAVSELLVDAACEIGAKVIFTYHTPTMSCARGTMMIMGLTPCDGVLETRRCTACVLEKHGIPTALRQPLAFMPEFVGAALGAAGLHGGPLTALRMSALLAAGHRRFHSLMAKADRIVAVCDWVAEVLRRNGVAESKLIVSRQGLPYRPSKDNLPTRPQELPNREDGPLRIGYFGRLDQTKGIDFLIRAFSQGPRVHAELDVFGIVQPGSERYANQLRAMAAADARIVFCDPLSAEEVVPVMRRYDIVAVPSQWLETGPLVVLEAFAAGTPVLGSRLGGIAELVREGIDGLLVRPDDVSDWAGAIERLARDRSRVRALRAGIRPPRTMDDVAEEMAGLYRDLDVTRRLGADRHTAHTFKSNTCS